MVYALSLKNEEGINNIPLVEGFNEVKNRSPMAMSMSEESKKIKNEFKKKESFMYGKDSVKGIDR